MKLTDEFKWWLKYMGIILLPALLGIFFIWLIGGFK